MVAGPIHSISSSVEPSWPICLWWFALITSHRRRQGNHKVSLLVSHNFYKTEHPQTYYFYLFSSWCRDRVPSLAWQILLCKRNVIIQMEFSIMINTLKHMSVNVYSFMSVMSLCADIISIFSSETNCQQFVIRPIKRIVLFPVHLKQFPWVGRKVFLFFILYNFACKIHGVGGKKFGFNILTYITLFFFRHKKTFCSDCCKKFTVGGVAAGSVGGPETRLFFWSALVWIMVWYIRRFAKPRLCMWTMQSWTFHSVHENHRPHRTFPKPKCLTRDFTNLNRIYNAHRTNV